MLEATLSILAYVVAILFGVTLGVWWESRNDV